jgi:predicted RecB family nuclease
VTVQPADSGASYDRRVATRYDVSVIPPQGGYPAKQCPVRAQWDVIRPADPLPPTPLVERRWALGVAFEQAVVADLLTSHPGACLIPVTDHADPAGKASREAATLQAMRAGTPLIIGGRLPADGAGRRVGEPDLLVAARRADRIRYRPVDVKHHRTLRNAVGDQPATCSPLDQPWHENAAPNQSATARRRRDDLLQLAHYQRMLEAIDLAADDGRLGGIIGTEGVVTWYDLDAPSWHTRSSGSRRKPRSTMDVYDFEFAFRLDIIAVATRHLADPAVKPLVVPVRISECDDCPWWSWCGPQLRSGSGDVSLVPGIGWRAWRIHRDHGVSDRAALAALDYRTATLVAAGVDLRPVLAAVDAEPDDTRLADLDNPPDPRQLATLAAAGVATVGDARLLSAQTASYWDAPMRDLAKQIDQARAALGASPAYRRRGIDQVSVPRGDVEVDVDMESTEDGVYLWGSLVTISAKAGGAADRLARPGYRAFASWDRLTEQVEDELFSEFWQWLTGLRRTAVAAGFSFRAYCYNAAAENGQLRRIADRLGWSEQVAEFTASSDWIDLLAVFDRQVVTGGPIGLKQVTTLCGFEWQVPDPGGANAVVRYDTAVDHSDPAAAQAARRWLLDYNRSDVMATKALRDWLDNAASLCPTVAGLC